MRRRAGEVVDVDGVMELLEDRDAVPLHIILNAGWVFRDGGLYAVYQEGILVYVGCTARPLRLRLQEHERRADTLLGEAIERGDRFVVRVIEPSELEGHCLEEVELALIQELRPGYNRKGLLPSKYTGEAKRRYEEKQQRWEERREELEYREEIFYKAVSAFQSHTHDAEMAARAYITERTAYLPFGEGVDVQQLGLEAFEVYLAVLDMG